MPRWKLMAIEESKADHGKCDGVKHKRDRGVWINMGCVSKSSELT